jgi:hypothetical protein
MTLLLTMVPSLVKGIFGMSQMNKANQIENQNPRPNEQVTPAITQMMGLLKGQSMATDIPGGENARNQIGGATAAGVNAASNMSSGAEGIGAANQMVATGQNAQAGLAGQAQQYVAGKQSEYTNAMGQYLAPEQRRVESWNKEQPYLQAMQTARELRTAGPQNMFGGVSGMFGAGAAAAAPDFYSMLNSGKTYGGTKGGGVTLDDLMKEIQSLGGNKSSLSKGFPVAQEGFTS